jgi:hypothetical protein
MMGCRLKPVLALAVLLCGCGGENPDQDDAGEVVAKPASYYIRQVDLYREVPNDICRSANPEFIQTLFDRVVSRVLAEGYSAPAFEDFNAVAAYDGKGMEAVLRFRANQPGGVEVMMFAVGPFEPAGCKVGQMRGGVGPHPHDPRSTNTFVGADVPDDVILEDG